MRAILRLICLICLAALIGACAATPTTPAPTPLPATATPTVTATAALTATPSIAEHPQGIFGQIVASGMGVEPDCSHTATEAELAACQAAPPDEPLSGEKVLQFTNLTTEAEFDIQTNSDGSYRVPLPAADYRLCYQNMCTNVRVPPHTFIEVNTSIPRP